MVVLIILIAMFLVAGVLMMNGKLSFLIAGYNTMSAKEKSAYNVVALSKFMGLTMLMLSGCLILLLLGAIFNSDTFFTTGGVLTLVITLLAVVYANTGKRFKVGSSSHHKR